MGLRIEFGIVRINLGFATMACFLIFWSFLILLLFNEHRNLETFRIHPMHVNEPTAFNIPSLSMNEQECKFQYGFCQVWLEVGRNILQ